MHRPYIRSMNRWYLTYALSSCCINNHAFPILFLIIPIILKSTVNFPSLKKVPTRILDPMESETLKLTLEVFFLFLNRIKKN